MYDFFESTSVVTDLHIHYSTCITPSFSHSKQVLKIVVGPSKPLRCLNLLIIWTPSVLGWIRQGLRTDLRQFREDVRRQNRSEDAPPQRTPEAEDAARDLYPQVPPPRTHCAIRFQLWRRASRLHDFGALSHEGKCTIKASNFGPHGTFGPYLAKSVASGGE